MFNAYLRTNPNGSSKATWDCILNCGQRTAVAVVDAEGPTTLFLRSMNVPSKSYAVMMHQEIKKFFKEEGFKALRYNAGPGVVTEGID